MRETYPMFNFSSLAEDFESRDEYQEDEPQAIVEERPVKRGRKRKITTNAAYRTDSSMRKDRAYSAGAYVSGSAAIAASPVTRVEERPERRPARVVREAASPANTFKAIFFTGFIGVVIVFTVVIAAKYISAINTRSMNASAIASMQSEIAKLHADNEAKEIAINAAIDYNEIREIAIEELGMVNAEKSQIRTYESGDENEYLIQYSDAVK